METNTRKMMQRMIEVQRGLEHKPTIFLYKGLWSKYYETVDTESTALLMDLMPPYHLDGHLGNTDLYKCDEHCLYFSVTQDENEQISAWITKPQAELTSLLDDPEKHNYELNIIEY